MHIMQKRKQEDSDFDSEGDSNVEFSRDLSTYNTS